MQEYIEIVSTQVEDMTLLQARLATSLNLRPEIEPDTDGVLIVQDDTVRWMTYEEFERSPLYRVRKGAWE